MIALPGARLEPPHDHLAGQPRALGPIAQHVLGRPAIFQEVVALRLDPACTRVDHAERLADHRLDQDILRRRIVVHFFRARLESSRRGRRSFGVPLGRACAAEVAKSTNKAITGVFVMADCEPL